MKIPRELLKYAGKIARLNLKFEPYLMNSVSVWLSQFDREEVPFMIKLLENFEIIDYAGMITYCQKVNFKLLGGGHVRRAFVGLGPAGKSGQTMAYLFRTANGLSDSDFFTQDNWMQAIERGYTHIIFLDDFLGTGQQASQFFKDLFNSSVIDKKIKITYAPLLAHRKGVENVLQATKEIGINVNLAFARELTEDDRAFSNNHIFKSQSVQENAKDICRSYGVKLYDQHPLGYCEDQFLLGFYYSTPDNTLPVFWSSNNGWKPLFRRFDPASKGEFLIQNMVNSVTFSNALLPFFQRHFKNKTYILWVDDLPENNALEKNILGLLGIQCFDATSNKDAFEELNRNLEKYSLVVTDLFRIDENENGYDLVNRLLGSNIRLSVVFYVGNTYDVDKTKIAAEIPVTATMPNLIATILSSLLK